MSGSESTLSSLLTTLNRADEGLISLTPEAQKEIAEKLFEKVDSYYYVVEKMDTEIARLKHREEELAAARKTLENNKNSLKELMLYHMKEKGFDKLTGNDVSVSLLKRKGVAYTLISEPDALTARQWPAFVNHSYSWNKKELGAAIKADPDRYKELGHVVENEYLKFNVRKDI